MARIDVMGWRAAQLLAPIAVAAGVVARRWGEPIFQIAVGVFYLYLLRGFVRAYRRLGWRELEVIGGALRLGDIEIARSAVQNWVVDETVARLFGAEVSWRLQAAVADGATLQSSLAKLFGTPLPLARRGSRLANGVAAGVSLAGLGLLAIGVGADDPRFGFAGLLVASFGLPGWYALSRKIVR